MTRRLIDKDRVREQRRQVRLMLALERKFAPKFRNEIIRASVMMIKGFKNTGSVPNKPEDHEIKIANIYKQVALITFEVFGSRIIEQGKAAGLILETKDFAEFFQRIALEYINGEKVRQRIVSIGETTRNQIVAIVEIGQSEGLSVAQIASKMAKAIPSISRQRAALIARTETHGAANSGADAAARSLGLDLQKEWVAAADERTRIAHAEADGQVVDMDQPFMVGGELLMYPSDANGSPENTINCRCAVSHIVVE